MSVMFREYSVFVNLFTSDKMDVMRLDKIVRSNELPLSIPFFSIGPALPGDTIQNPAILGQFSSLICSALSTNIRYLDGSSPDEDKT